MLANLREQLALWDTRVVMVTALSEGELRPFRRMAGKLGVDEFIVKPVTREWVRSLAARSMAQPSTGC